jgi:hypothetical protein
MVSHCTFDLARNQDFNRITSESLEELASRGSFISHLIRGDELQRVRPAPMLIKLFFESLALPNEVKRSEIILLNGTHAVGAAA